MVEQDFSTTRIAREREARAKHGFYTALFALAEHYDPSPNNMDQFGEPLDDPATWWREARDQLATVPSEAYLLGIILAKFEEHIERGEYAAAHRIAREGWRSSGQQLKTIDHSQ